MFWLLALTRVATMTIRTTRTTEEKLRYPTMKRSARRFLLAAHPPRVRSVIRRARRMRSSLRTCSPLVHAGHPWVSLTGQCYGCCTCRCTLRCTCVLPERERWDDARAEPIRLDVTGHEEAHRPDAGSTGSRCHRCRSRRRAAIRAAREWSCPASFPVCRRMGYPQATRAVHFYRARRQGG